MSSSSKLAGFALYSTAMAIADDDDDDDEIAQYNLLLSTAFDQSGRARGVRRPLRRYFWQDCLAMTDHEFKRHYRIHPDTFGRLSESLAPLWNRSSPRSPNGEPVIPVDEAVAVFLWRVATGESFRAIGARFGRADSTACDVTWAIANLILQTLSGLVQLPRSNAELESLAREFESKYKMKYCIAAIDGCIIRLARSPNREQSQLHNCRKQFHAVQVQGVCTANLLFLDLFAGMPGSANDRGMFNASPASVMLPRLLHGTPYFIAGDSAYPLERWLLKAWPDAEVATNVQKVFNARLAKCRCRVEHGWGAIKWRWRMLKCLDCDLAHAATYIGAVVLLHNLTVLFKDKWSKAEFPPPPDIRNRHDGGDSDSDSDDDEDDGDAGHAGGGLVSVTGAQRRLQVAQGLAP